MGIYFANVDCGSWNVESGLASHATIHGVYLHGSCTVNCEIFQLAPVSVRIEVINSSLLNENVKVKIRGTGNNQCINVVTDCILQKD